MVPAHTDMLDRLDGAQYQVTRSSGPSGPRCYNVRQARTDDRSCVTRAKAVDRCASAPPSYSRRLRACFRLGQFCPRRAALQRPDIYDRHPSRSRIAGRRSGYIKEAVYSVRALSRLLDDCYGGACAIDGAGSHRGRLARAQVRPTPTAYSGRGNAPSHTLDLNAYSRHRFVLLVP